MWHQIACMNPQIFNIRPFPLSGGLRHSATQLRTANYTAKETGYRTFNYKAWRQPYNVRLSGYRLTKRSFAEMLSCIFPVYFVKYGCGFLAQNGRLCIKEESKQARNWKPTGANAYPVGSYFRWFWTPDCYVVCCENESFSFLSEQD